MKLLQLYYTSCKRGHAAGSGFQVYSASEEFSAEEIKELERLCMYIPPDHLPSQPTPEEIANDFPISFSSFRLKSGRYGVCQSVYLGKDYSERYGNYFSHAFVLEEGEWPFAPILLHGSSLFRKNLTLEELEIAHRPSPLPVVNMPEPDGLINGETVKEFLSEQDRYEHLEAMLNGLIECGGEAGSLVLAGIPEDIPYWLGAIQFSVPLEIAGNLSFSTYVYNPDRADYVISVTLDQGTRFTFQDLKRRSNTYGFNFVRGIYSSIPNTYRYPKMVVENRLNIDSFKNFYNGFTLTAFDEALDQALDLYSIQDAVSSKLEFSHLDGAIQFADKYVPAVQKGNLVSQLSLDQLLISSTSLSSAKLVSSFLIETCNETKKEEHEKKAVQFLLETVRDFVTDDGPLEEVHEYLNSQWALMDKRELIESSFLQKENLISLNEHLREMNDESKGRFYLKVALQFTVNKHDWRELSKEQREFILQYSSKQLNKGEVNHEEWILHVQNPEFFGHFLLAAQVKFPKTEQSEKTTKLLTIVLAQKENDLEWKRSWLAVMNESEKGTDIIYLYYRRRLEKSFEKTKELIKIMNETSHLSRFIDPLYVTYYENLFSIEHKILDEAIEIMKHQKLKEILSQKKLLTPILEESQNHIEFADSQLNKHYREYESMFAEYEAGHILGLALMTRKVKLKEKGIHLQARKTIEGNVGKLTDKQMQSYLLWSLPELLELSYTRKQEDQAMLLYLVKNYPQYVLSALHQRKMDAKMQHTAELFIEILSAFQRKKAVSVFHDSIIEYLINHQEEGKKINELLKKEKKLQKTWETIYEEVQEKTGHSFMRSVKKLFGSKR